jgi:hypothetical protein
MLRRLLLLVCCVAAPAWAQAPGSAAHLSSWLAGEWNNNEQVWQQKIDLADPKVTAKPTPVEHRHHVVLPFEAPALPAGTWFFMQASAGEDLKAQRKPMLLRLVTDASLPNSAALRLETWAFIDEAAWADAHVRKPELAALTSAALRQAAGCDVPVRYDDAARAYSGNTAARSCPMPRSLRVTETTLQDNAAIARKARYYEGWVWFRNAGPGSSADDKDTSFAAKFSLHNEGQKLALKRKDGTDAPWVLELAVLTYQNTRRPVLKFALLDKATGNSISYVWIEPGGRTIGMNLGWFQSGLTLKAEGGGAFGF